MVYSDARLENKRCYRGRVSSYPINIHVGVEYFTLTLCFLFSFVVIYKGLDAYNLNNTMGYTSAKLQLMTMEYELFKLLPFNFCGEWIMNAAYSYQECPSDGVYHFEVPYKLPESEGISTWFATGWQGVSYLKIYKSQQDASAKLAHCKIHFKTFVTNAGEENWYALPSAAQTTIILFGVLGVLFLIVLCLACRPRRKHPTDDDYATSFKQMEDDENDKILAERDEESSRPLSETEKDVEEKARRLAVHMDYQKNEEK